MFQASTYPRVFVSTLQDVEKKCEGKITSVDALYGFLFSKSVAICTDTIFSQLKSTTECLKVAMQHEILKILTAISHIQGEKQAERKQYSNDKKGIGRGGLGTTVGAK